ncbi:MAG: ATP-binding cassette domain-containing protein [Bacillota bacterium]
MQTEHLNAQNNAQNNGEKVVTIETRNLTHTYGANTPLFKTAVSDVTFKVFEGDFFGILGHTGSGKSTLIQHFNYLLKPTSGEVFICGEKLEGNKETLTALRRRCGMVFQYPEYQLFGETCTEDVAFGLHNFYGLKTDKNPNGLSQEQITEKVRIAIERVGLNYNEIKDKSPFQLSGGQKRRLAIAGIIVTEPDILILDEPTAGLDPKGKGEILALIRMLHKQTTKTIIMISHDMDEIAENCNRIMVMKDGKAEITTEASTLFSSEQLMLEHCLDIPLVSKVLLACRKKGLNVKFHGTNREMAAEIAEEIRKAKLLGSSVKAISVVDLGLERFAKKRAEAQEKQNGEDTE